MSWNKTKNQLQITSNFNFKSPLTVVRANYGLSVAVFGFVIGGIVFEILSIFFGKITHFLEKVESFFHKIDNIPKIITARANPKIATESP